MTDFEKFVDENLDRIRKRSGEIRYGVGNFLGSTANYSPDLGFEIAAVLVFLLENIIWTSDLQTRGQVEHWSLPIFKEVDGVKAWRGDCDDFMAAFRMILRKLGWGEKCLRRAVCFVATPEKPKPSFDSEFNHAILCVNLSRGLLFLDNRFKDPMSLFRLRQQGYANFSICSAVDGFWHASDVV